jgi:hypothetical protein
VFSSPLGVKFKRFGNESEFVSNQHCMLATLAVCCTCIHLNTATDCMNS